VSQYKSVLHHSILALITLDHIQLKTIGSGFSHSYQCIFFSAYPLPDHHYVLIITLWSISTWHH